MSRDRDPGARVPVNVFEILIRERNEKEIDKSKSQAKANWSIGPRAEERKVKVGEETDESEEGEKKLINNLKSTEKRNKWKG